VRVQPQHRQSFDVIIRGIGKRGLNITRIFGGRSGFRDWATAAF